MLGRCAGGGGAGGMARVGRRGRAGGGQAAPHTLWTGPGRRKEKRKKAAGGGEPHRRPPPSSPGWPLAAGRHGRRGGPIPSPGQAGGPSRLSIVTFPVR